MLNVVFERYPYRYITKGILENGEPDYRIQKHIDNKWIDMYKLDNKLQLMTCFDDHEYCKTLCGDPAYIKDVVTSPHNK